jgi:hypothetical protein
MDNKLINVARHACEKITILSLLASVSPQWVAATVVICVSYVASQRVDMTSITDVAMCRVSNISKIYSQLRPYIKTIFPKDFVLAEEKGINSLPLNLEE